MAVPVVTGASLACTMGLGTGALTATSQTKVLLCGMPAATVFDVSPITNLSPIGMCTSMANPTVAAATAAALGVLTPMPCLPSPAGIWVSQNTPLLGGMSGLANDASLTCAYGGAISILSPGQTNVFYS